MNPGQKNKTIIAISLLTIVACFIVMSGWVFDNTNLQSVIPGFIAMRFNTALCFVLFATALLIVQYKTGKNTTLIFFILSLLGTLIGLITFSQEAFHYNSGIDQVFVFDKTVKSAIIPFPGRMAFNAAINFVFLGFGFLGLTLKKRPFDVLSQYLFHIVTILSTITLIGYLFGVSLFHTFWYQTSMASYTGILFLILSIAAALINPSVGITRLFTGQQIGNQMAKRLFALIIIMVIMFGVLEVHTQGLQLFSSLNTEISLLAVCFLLASLLLIWNTANWLNKIDTQRYNAEDKVRLMNFDLEKRVQERTAEFQKSEEKYHSLIEQASDAIYILDLNGNFTDVNASMCKMIGYTRKELLQLKIEDIIDPEELKIDPLPKSINNPKLSVVRERTFIGKNGVSFNVEVNVKVFSDDKIMVIARDITDRKKMETELRDAELKFRTIAEKSIVGVYIVQKGKFTYVNPRFAAVFDYEPEELINTFDIEIVFHESFRATANEHVRRRVAGEVESVHYEAIGRKKNGESNWVEFYGSRAIIGGQPTIIGSMIDITERKKAEDALKSSEQKYKLLFESNPMPMWMIAKDDQTVIAVNDAAANHYGYTKEELINLKTNVFRSPEDLGEQIEGYKQEMDNSDTTRVVRHLKKDGTMMFVNIIAHDIIFEGRPVRLSLTNDITEKLKAEESLRKSEANLQTILNTTDTAYALFDTELKVQAFNQMANHFIKEQYGHVPEKGDSLPYYFPKDRFPRFINFTKEVLTGKNINYEVEYPKADGSLLWYDVRLFPITNNNKEILGILMALYDITERKNTEQDLKRAYDRIQNHINSIKNMAWKQSHLIRSPLANLKGLVAMLSDDRADIEVFNHIHTELDRMDAIIIEMAEDASDHDIYD